MVEFKNSERGVGPVIAVANSAIVKAKLPKIEKFRKIDDPALAA
ncbi:hypothetical protein [Rhizobium sp. MHM7A]|nr:hypothetical protein [Rhizobium sp. MHM7A]